MEDISPREIAAELDKYVVGQAEAKRALAVALRNRLRRRQLSPEMAKEVTPKNLLLIGPTGVGKTELARRLAEMIDAPFIKVEASKFTEVGYVGRDVESIIHDLVETSVSMVHQEKLHEVQDRAEDLAQERIVSYLCQQSASAGVASRERRLRRGRVIRGVGREAGHEVVAATGQGDRARLRRQRQRWARLLSSHKLEDQVIEIEVRGYPEDYGSPMDYDVYGYVGDDGEGWGSYAEAPEAQPPLRRRRVSVRDARRILAREEANRLIDFDALVDAAIQRVEENGVVFIDEMDKICRPTLEHGIDVSGQGVQRDLLPLLDGSTVITRYGPMSTAHILFIGAGSFHQAKPSDLIPELQGRFPLRVELTPLSQKDFERILLEPANSLVKQYQALLATEGIDLVFTEDGISEIAAIACEMNQRIDDVGARRLHTVLEKALEEISYAASERRGERVVIDAQYVRARLAAIVQNVDLSQHIL